MRKKKTKRRLTEHKSPSFPLDPRGTSIARRPFTGGTLRRIVGVSPSTMVVHANRIRFVLRTKRAVTAPTPDAETSLRI